LLTGVKSALRWTLTSVNQGALEATWRPWENITMSDLAVETVPDVAQSAHEAARGQVVYITEHGERLAAIVPAAIATELERLSHDELTELLEDFADAAAARRARASVEAGERLIPWEQVKAEVGL
jgi:antitoxin (DNA-binding transcriptional repressor) of toxin-antitoxin stability system